MSKRQEFLLETFESFFNNPSFSDIELHIGDHKYYLISALVSKCAPLILSNVTVSDNTTDQKVDPAVSLSANTIPSDTTGDYASTELSSLLSSLASQMSTRKIIKFPAILNLDGEKIKQQHCGIPSDGNYTISNDVIMMLLGSMYVLSLEFTLENIEDIYVVAHKFGMSEIIEYCLKLLSEDAHLDLFTKIYCKSADAKVAHIKELRDFFIKKMATSTSDEILSISNQLSFDEISSILQMDYLPIKEDLIYDIVCSWGNLHKSVTRIFHRVCILMNYVKLDKLSVDKLLSEAKMNAHINKEKYYNTLENIVSSTVAIRSVSILRMNKFAIGKRNGTYENYRLVTKSDIQTSSFVKEFANVYTTTDGIYCLDSFYGDILYCQSAALAIDVDGTGSRLRLRKFRLTKNTYVRLNSTHAGATDVIKNIGSIRISNTEDEESESDMGLFVLH